MPNDEPRRRPPRPPTPAGARIPPQSIEAEQSLLGALLLSADATETVVDAGLVNVTDFVKPAHQYIYNAIRGLRLAGSAVDAVIVSAELGRAGLLDEIGGIQALLELQAVMPAISNAARYAKIVAETAQLRRLIATGSEIAAIGYGSPSDIAAAAAQARGLVEDLASTYAAVGGVLDVADLRALMAAGLKLPQCTIGQRSDGARFIYPGKIHLLVAETTSGKGWVALQWCLEVLVDGGTCVYLDYEDTPTSVTRRLLTLGATDEMIADQFTYIRPQGLGPVERAELRALLVDRNPDLIVIDALAGAMSREGLDENKNPEIEQWMEQTARWIVTESRGAAVLALDHLIKDEEKRGRFSRGGGRKLEAVDVSYGLRVIRTFSREKPGQLRMTCNKDKGGNFHTGEQVGEIDVTPAGLGEALRVVVKPVPTNVSKGGEWQPTSTMADIARVLAETAQPLTASAIGLLFPSHKPRVVQHAIATLMRDGYVAESRKGRAKTLRLLRDYEDVRAVAPEPALFDGGEFEVPDMPDHVADEEYRRSFERLDDQPGGH